MQIKQNNSLIHAAITRIVYGTIAFALLICWLPPETRANTTPFQILNRTSSLDTSNPIENALYTAFGAAADDVANSINTTYMSESSRRGFTDAIARANASGSSALMMDRGSDPSLFSGGLGGQINFYPIGSLLSGGTNIQANNSLPTVGASLQTGFTFGVPAGLLGLKNIGPISGSRLMIFLSGMSFSGTVSSVTYNMFDLGLNLQYKVVPSIGASILAKWGGVSVGTGLNYSTNSVSISGHLDQSSTMPSGTDTATIRTVMDYALGVSANTFTIPFEFSTYATVFYAFEVYGGMSMDLNFGSAKLTGGASGPLSASTTSPVATANLFSGTAQLTLDDASVVSSPATVLFRTFGGVQMNVALFKLAFEATSLSNGSGSLSALMRISL